MLHHRSRLLSLRFQLLFAVNAVLAIVLTLALGFDYSRDLKRNIKLRRFALEEEAKAIAAAIPAMPQSDSIEVQRLIERFCDSLDHRSSPGHHIVVQWNDEFLQPKQHGQATAELTAEIVNADTTSRKAIVLQNHDRITAKIAIDHGAVFVSEQVAEILQEVRQASLGRLLGLIVSGIFAAAVVNAVLVRALIRPVECLP